MKIIVGISGGVDSAVAALLLKRRGHEVTGLFMKNWEEDDSAGRCGAAEDLKLALGAEYIATGHYARVDNHAGRFRLLKARDINKDQSYFLYLLGQESLAHTLFPIGELAKPEVRRLAQEAGLPNYDRQDSTGICFIGERDFKSFLARYLPAQAGEMRTLAGLLKGKHDGVMYYTIGQRHGLGIGGEGEAWYVVGKDVANNILYVEQGEQHPALFSEALIAGQLHWIGAEPLPWPRKLRAKTRYRQPDQDCTVAPHDKGLRVMFDNPQRAVTPGQSVVFYDSGEWLGGGIIEEAIPATRAVAARSALH